MTEQKHYPREFKFEALEVWHTSGKPAAQIERDLGLSTGQLPARSRQTYGSPRIHAKLRAQG